MGVLGFRIPAYGATINAASCSQSAVAGALDAANRNDTVAVPSGTCSWSTPVSLTKGITLVGAGAGNTIITSSGGARLVSVAPDSTAIANSENITISGFTFDGGGASGADVLIEIQGASGITGIQPYRYLIVGNNTFQNTNTTSSNAAIQADPNGNGQIRGVIYSNTFDRCNIILRAFSNNDTREWSNTAFNQSSYGTGDNLYFEDNKIIFSSSYTGNNPGWTEIGQGGRIVMRYNNWDFTNATTPQEIWDIHGFQNWNGTINSGQTGTMISEYYGNTIANAGTYRWINDRSGWGIFFDNMLTGSGGNSIDLYGISTPGSCPSDISPTPTNYNPAVNNSYFWNNTQNGTNITAGMDSTGDPIHCSVTQNANWWNYDSSCTASSCSAGVGTGTAQPSGTCTPGVGYWMSSTPAATTSASIIQNGALYKCMAANSWTRYYTPYTYPHPMRSNSGSPGPPTGGSQAVQPPTNVTATVH